LFIEPPPFSGDLPKPADITTDSFQIELIKFDESQGPIKYVSLRREIFKGRIIRGFRGKFNFTKKLALNYDNFDNKKKEKKKRFKKMVQQFRENIILRSHHYIVAIR